MDFFSPYIRGGAEISTNKIIESLPKNFEVTVLTQHFQNKMWIEHGIEVIPNLALTDQKFNKTGKVERIVNLVFFPIINFLQTVKLINSEDFSIINVVPTTFFLLPCLIAALLTRKRVVIDARSFTLTVFDDELLNKNLLNEIKLHYLFDFVYFSVLSTILKISLKFKRNYKIIAVSEFIKNTLVDSGYSRAKIEVIYNFIDEKNVINEEKRENIIVFAGRLTKDKGVWNAIYGFLEANLTNYKLLLIGEGNEKNNILKFIEEKGQKNIKLLGKLTNSEVLQNYSKSKLILAPSNWPEPFGRFVLEAIETNTPVITSSAGGVAELMMKSKIGVAVKPGSINDLSLAIRSLLENEDFYEEIKKNIFTSKMIFDKKNLISQRVKIYNEE